MSPEKPSRWFHVRWSGTDSTVGQAILLILLSGVVLSFVYTLVWLTPLFPSSGSGWLNQTTVFHPEGAPDTVHGVEALRDDVTVRGTDSMVLTFHDPGTRERLLLALPILLRQITGFIVIYLVLRIIQSLKTGDPFVMANVRRVYGIAFTVMTAALLWVMADGVTAAALQRTAVATPEVVFAEFRLGSGFFNGLITGFLLAALAEVFRRGTRTREDVDGLV